MAAGIRFSDALRLAARAVADPSLPPKPPVRVIRDVYGRIRFAVDVEKKSYPPAALQVLEGYQRTLGHFATGNSPFFRDSFSDPGSVFQSADWHRTMVPLGLDANADEAEVLLLDRQIVGQDWLLPPVAEDAEHPQRLVFFGLKGGVGRSTALMMVAWGLARQGKNVLLVDFDLESPGLSSLVLPQVALSPCGVVDWLVEDAVGQGDVVLSDLVSRSPLGDTTPGYIRVVAAMGQEETEYLAKLARVYADKPGLNGPERMGARLQRLIETLEAREKPDVVLIDSRAGLHDLAAVAITHLADTALLFGTGGSQSWHGYRQLFEYWRRRPEVAARVRERLAMVRALTPKSNREGGIARFRQEAYQLFSETLYDEIPPGADKGTDYFHPNQTDQSAPHFPILIDWDERFQEFDPHLRPEDGGVTEAQIEATFGALIEWALATVGGKK